MIFPPFSLSIYTHGKKLFKKLVINDVPLALTNMVCNKPDFEFKVPEYVCMIALK